MDKVSISKFLALVLRHKPEVIGLTIDRHGWCNVHDLVDAFNKKYNGFTFNDLKEIVATDNKQRYSFNDDMTLIRANQGHSIKVDVELEEKIPPSVLYHGTATKYVSMIEESGLLPKSRIHVHLSSDLETAILVGSRHGEPVIYSVDTERMVKDGYKFFHSKNGIWLTDKVPPQYLTKL